MLSGVNCPLCETALVVKLQLEKSIQDDEVVVTYAVCPKNNHYSVEITDQPWFSVNWPGTKPQVEPLWPRTKEKR